MNASIEPPLDLTPPQILYEHTNSNVAVHTLLITQFPSPTASSYLPQRLVHIPPTPAADNHLPLAVESSSDSIISSNTITDVYSLDASGKPAFARTSNPFLATPSLQRPQGERVQFLAVIDNGTMINAIDTAAYQQVARQLAPLGLSTRTL